MKITEKEYYDYLFEILKDYSLLPKNEVAERVVFQHSFDVLKFPDGLISKIRSEFGVGFENVFFTNARKALLVRNNYTEEPSLILERTAVYFAVLGCILDFMIDNGTAKQRKKAFHCLSLENCKWYFTDFSLRKTNSVVDELFEYIGNGLRYIKTFDKNKYDEILELIRKAADSEIYVSGEMSESRSVTDKSILFVIISLKIITADLQIEENALFEHIAYAIQLIDDVCDVFEDKVAGHSNPILLLLTGSNNDYSIISNAANEILGHMNAIKENGSASLYDFVMYEIREWCMSCTYIREKVWNNGKYNDNKTM